jgi:DNA excision repair protein ERCC-2
MPNQILFPYEKIRPIQGAVMKDMHRALMEKKHIIAHAPTGLGKSAASLSVALKVAIEKNLTIFFLTSRHTQHKIAVQTLKDIQKRYSIKINTVDIIGKKWMCPVPGVTNLFSSEFNEYCKKQREELKCEYYVKTKKNHQLTTDAKAVLGEIEGNIYFNGELVSLTADKGHCPYELAIEMGKDARVVIADYNYIFNQRVSDSFMKKTGKALEQSIIIVDEAHNLPSRVRDGVTVKLSSFMIDRAMKEAEKYEYDETLANLNIIKGIFKKYKEDLIEKANLGGSREKIMTKDAFIDAIRIDKDYDELTKDLEFIGEAIRELQKKSFIAGVASFLTEWKGKDFGFTRILGIRQTKQQPIIELAYKCLDPSVITTNIIDNTYACVFMSGTLTPTEMYKDTLGVHEPIEKVYENPFPEGNRLNLIVPKTTTKYAKRTEEQFQAIAEECRKIIDAIPGNSVIFFPSYFIRDKVHTYLSDKVKKTVFLEQRNMSQTDKHDFLERFKRYKDVGAVILGVVSGNYSEGIDLPGDLLKGVVIVGLPLQQPNLETKELIKYFDDKFQRGWAYGYIFPAFNKTLQSAGRCIRSEEDKGVVIFLEERYLWPMYKGCFPRDQEYTVTKEPAEHIEEFFS